MIVILLGGSACGKNVIAKCLVRGAIAQNPYEKVPTESCSRLIGITTRPKRLSEQDGVDYNFVSKEQFLQLIYNDKLFEYRKYNVLVDGTPDVWYYGFPKTELDLTRNYVVVADVDGAKRFISRYGAENCYVVFVSMSDGEREYRAKNQGFFDKSEWVRRNSDDIVKLSSKEVLPICDQYYCNDGMDYRNYIDISSIIIGMIAKRDGIRYMSMNETMDSIRNHLDLLPLDVISGLCETWNKRVSPHKKI